MNQYRKERVEIAKFVISKMWECDEPEFTLMKKRNRNIVLARRFFIYYLWKHCEVKHNRMKDYIHGMNHATSIHHCRKLEQEMEIYKDVLKSWITFLYYSDKREYDKLKIDMKYPIETMNDLDLNPKYIFN